MSSITKKFISFFLLQALFFSIFLEEKVEEPEEVAVGIDLGTTYSVIAFYHKEDGNVEIIANEDGEQITPSVVLYDPATNKFTVGSPAKEYAGENPNIFYDAKRLIGRNFNDTHVKKDIPSWPFKIINKEGRPVFKVQYDLSKGQKDKGKTFSPEEISSKVLLKLKKAAEKALGKKITKAVITVPAYFGTKQREDTKLAGELTGLEVLRVVNEPTAAALAFGLDRNKDKEELVLVYDLGGGTFDVSILEIENGIFEVKASTGHSHLGGQDFDKYIVNHFLEKKNINFNTLSNKEKKDLKNEAEKVKKTLSSKKGSTFSATIKGKKVSLKITRTEFSKMISDSINKTIELVKNVINDSKRPKSEIQHIVLIGGSTRIPFVRDKIAKFFNKVPLTKIDPDKAVAYGAAIQAAVLTKVKSEKLDDLLLVDVTPLNLGIETAGGAMTTVINKNERIPLKREQRFTTVSRNQTEVLIKVLQGVNPLARKNRALGDFRLEGIGLNHPEIIITFSINANGIVTVHAIEKGNNIEREIEFSNAHSLSEDEKNRILEEFKQSEENDQREADIIRIRESIKSGSVKILEEGKANEEVKRKLEEILKEINMIEEYDEEAMEKAKELNARFLSILQTMGAAPGEAAGEGKDYEEPQETGDEYEDDEL